MKSSTTVHSVWLALCWPILIFAQDKAPLPVHGNINFQRIKTDGTSFFLVRRVADKTSKPKLKTRIVLVPFKTDKGTEYKEQEQTYLDPVMHEKLVPIPANYSFVDIHGKTVSKKEMMSELGMAKDGLFLVMLFADQKIPTAFKQLLRKDTVFIQPHKKIPKRPNK